jgi:hypothetical protein
MADPSTVARDPRLKIAKTWSDNEKIYGLMTATGGSANTGQLVVTRPNGVPEFYSADASDYDIRGGGTIKSTFGTIVSSGGVAPMTNMTNRDGAVSELNAGTGITRQNLETTLVRSAPAPGLK